MEELLLHLESAVSQATGYIYPNEAELHWSLLVVVYPYVTGIVAGAFILASLEKVFNVQAVKPTYRLALLTALAEVESSFDPLAVSPKGARGLLQLMPATAERFGVGDPFDVAQNVEGGARYLSWLLDRFGGRADLALAGYNAGEGAVDRHRGVPPYPETRRYVRLVLEGAARLDDPAR